MTPTPEQLRWMAFTDPELAELRLGVECSTDQGVEYSADVAYGLARQIEAEQSRRRKTHAARRSSA
jgi:hypothetical protein